MPGSARCVILQVLALPESDASSGTSLFPAGSAGGAASLRPHLRSARLLSRGEPNPSRPWGRPGDKVLWNGKNTICKLMIFDLSSGE